MLKQIVILVIQFFLFGLGVTLAVNGYLIGIIIAILNVIFIVITMNNIINFFINDINK